VTEPGRGDVSAKKVTAFEWNIMSPGFSFEGLSKSIATLIVVKIFEALKVKSKLKKL